MHALWQVARRTRFVIALWASILIMVIFSALPASAGGNSGGNGHNDSAVLRIDENAAGAVTVRQASLCAGVVTVTVRSRFSGQAGHDIEIFNLHKGTTLAQLRSKLAVAFNPATPGPEVGKIVQGWINQHVTIFGGYQSQTAGQLTYEVVLPAGAYFAIDLNESQSQQAVARFWVHGRSNARLESTGQSVKMVEVGPNDQFAVSTEHNRLRAGWLRIVNTTSELHFAAFQPVKPGTTNNQVTAMFKGGPNVTIPGDAPGTGVLSPGVKINLRLGLPAGTYAIACFMPDKATGMPHAMPPMNMHVVVTVRGG